MRIALAGASAAGVCGFGTAAVSFTGSRQFAAELGISLSKIAYRVTGWYRVIIRQEDEIHGRAKAACSHASPGSAVMISMLALLLLFVVATEAVWSITNGTRPRIYMYPEVDPSPACQGCILA